MIPISAEDVFSINSDLQFEKLAIEIFRYQASENDVYRDFVKALRVDTDSVSKISQIPFLPVEFFKSHQITCVKNEPEIIFSSSGTTGMVTSRHPVADLSMYVRSFRQGFEHFYGDIRDYTLLALLPNYLERDGSSLIYMVDDLIKGSLTPDSGYFLYNHKELFDKLSVLQSSRRKVILIGVTYALLDFADSYQLNFPELIVMETGGMKGKRKEMIRDELHSFLCERFGVSAIHSEYGMTELLSQGYSKGDGIFRCPSWMKVLTRDINDPLSYLAGGLTGGVNVIDLANLHSCSFLATQDLGKVYTDGSFEILGRFDNSDIRGCNLLVQ